jgi:hypothetical protein
MDNIIMNARQSSAIERPARVNNHPAAARTPDSTGGLNAATPQPPKADNTRDASSLSIIWPQVARDVGRGALIGGGAAVVVGVVMPAVLLVGDYLTGGNVKDTAEALGSLVSGGDTGFEKSFIAGIATVGTAVTLALATPGREAVPRNKAKRLSRPARVACHVVGAALPLVAGYATFQGMEKLEQMAAARTTVSAPQMTASTFTPR